jgi:hypothetical protein
MFRFLLVILDVTVELNLAEHMLDPFALFVLVGCIAILVLGIAAGDFSR